MPDNKKTLNEEELKKVSGGEMVKGRGENPDDDKEYYKNLADNNKLIHKIVREDGRNVPLGQYCGGFIKYFDRVSRGFECVKCGEWYNDKTRTCKEIFEKKFDVEIKEN